MSAEPVEAHTFTPAKYIAALREREVPILLEERLAHFIAWLEERGVILWNISKVVAGDGEGFACNTNDLVWEYVNT